MIERVICWLTVASIVEATPSRSTVSDNENEKDGERNAIALQCRDHFSTTRVSFFSRARRNENFATVCDI